MRPIEVFAQLYRRDPRLTITGCLNLVLLIAMLAIAPFDSRSIMGLNPWIKPIKFATSITIYVWTLAWFLAYLPNRGRLVPAISWCVSISMVIEIVLIIIQAARGTTSHYNFSTPFNTAVISTMAQMILLDTLLALVVLILFFDSRVKLPSAYLWGIRAGLAVFILAGAEGMVMIGHHAHTVGLPDGGPGLPILNWSTRAGDLRIAHLLGIHSLQALPLAGYLVSRIDALASRQLLWFGSFAIGYFALAVALFAQAMAGRPLVALQ